MAAPSPVPRAPAPTALLGGTFDPPHFGHLLLAECAFHQLGAQRVLFLPAGDPYKKSGSRQPGRRQGGLMPHASFLIPPSPAADRLAMTELAIKDNPHFALDDRETRRPGPTYTVDTLEELASESSAPLVLILGQDALHDLPTWKSPERILELATIAVAAKPGPAPSRPGTGLPAHIAVEMPPLAISSTLVRQRVANAQPIRYLVPDAVERYIAEHRLYRGRRK